MLTLNLFGWPQLRSDDQPVALETRKALALLAFLATTGEPHGRDRLAALFWPDYDAKRSRANLRRALWSVNQALGNESLVVDPDKVFLGLSAGLQVDVTEFLELTDPRNKAADSSGSAGAADPEIAKWTRAVHLYRDEFLAGFSLSDAPDFDKWQVQQAQHLFQRLVTTFERLVAAMTLRGEYQGATHYAQRWLAFDELNEDVHRQLMRLFAWQHNRPAALQQYESCTVVLAKELNVAPTQATLELYEAIRQGRLPPPETPAIDVAVISRPLAPNPYRGLRAFREEDSAYFYGRESQTQALIAAVDQQPVVALFGSSGSGKSSLIQAGLLASLRADGRWLIIQFRPGSRPFHALAAALNAAMPETSDAMMSPASNNLLAERLRNEAPALFDKLTQIAAATARVLLVADQFEELYTLCAEPELRHQFLARLLAPFHNPASTPKPPGTLLLGLRADFLGHALKFRPLADALQHRDLKLGPMSPEELRQAIQQPAQDAGIQFEAGLIDRLLDDVGVEPGNLPLLQFALTTLWRRQQNGLITHVAYDETGRVQGALATYADKVLAEFDHPGQAAARRVFVQLVQPGEGTEHTRRAAARTELGEANWQLVQRLADARLVVTGQNPVGEEVAELAHEALIHGWPQLREWMLTDRSFRLWQERLRGLARQWLLIDRDAGMLLRGLALVEAQGWLTQRREEIGAAEIEFIQASLRDKEEQEQSAAKAARAKARVQRWQRIGVALAVGLLAALAGTAAWQWQQARARELAMLTAQQQVSQEQELGAGILSRQLALHSRSLPADQMQLATLLSLEALNRAETLEARQTLLDLLNAHPYLKSIERGYAGAVTSVAFSNDDRLILSADTTGAVYFWNVATGEKRVVDVSEALGRATAMAAHPRESLLAIGGDNGVIQLWDTAKAEALSPSLAEHTGDVVDLDISADGRYLASLANDRRLLIWNLPAANLVAEPVLPPDPTLREIALSPDGRWLATGSQEGALQMRLLPAGEIVWPSFQAHAGEVTGLAFSPDGAWLASGGADGEIRLWQAATGAPVDLPLSELAGAVKQVLFSPDGRYLASSGPDNSVRLWRLDKQPASPETLFGPAGAVTSLAFSADGKRIVAGAADHTALLWDLSSHPLQAQIFGPAEAALTAVSLHPEGRWLAAGAQGGQVILWELESAAGRSLAAPGLLAASALAFSQDGQTLAVVDQQYKLAVWDLSTQSLLHPPTQIPGMGWGPVLFAPDGQTVLATASDQQLTLWDSRANSLLASVDAKLSFSYANVALSPDGRLLAVPDCHNQIVEWRVYDCSENNVRLWDIAEGRWLPRNFPGDLSLILAMAFSPDSTQLVATKIDGSLVTWDVATGSELSKSILTLNNIYMRAVQFSPEGSLLVASLETGQVLLWDVRAQHVIGSLPANHASAPVALTADGRLLATVDRRGQVSLWEIDLAAWKRRACERINRSLTAAEWAQYLGGLPYRETC